MSVVLLIASLAGILLACHIFTNAIEWVGMRFDVGHGFVGSVLAAIGTALPETIIPIIAIFAYHGDPNAMDIGIGAVAGAPFMLGTLGMFVTGAAVVVYSLLGKRSVRMNANTKSFSRDLLFFVIIYGLAVGTSFLHLPQRGAIRVMIAIGLVCCYVIYLKLTLDADEGHDSPLEDLILAKLFKRKPAMPLILLQLLISLAGIVYGSHVFVGSVESVSAMIGVPALILSLIVTPIATELPEKFNSVIWIGKRKDTLALGNITGAMVFQTCFPVGFAIVFTPWDLHHAILVSAILGFASAFINMLWVRIRKTVSPYVLLATGSLYGLFILYLVFREQLDKFI